MKPPTMVSGGGSGALGFGGHRAAADADLEEGRGQLALDLLVLELELVGQDADDADVEDQVGVGGCPELLDQRGLAGDLGGVDVERAGRSSDRPRSG